MQRVRVYVCACVYECVYVFFIHAFHKAGFDTRVFFYSGDIGVREVGHKPKLVPCQTILIISSLAFNVNFDASSCQVTLLVTD